MHDRLKIKKQLLGHEKISYATDVIELPKGGIDCSEGCNPYGFPPECADVVKNFDTSRLAPYPHSQALYDAIIRYWKSQCFVERENILITDGSINALYVINNIFYEFMSMHYIAKTYVNASEQEKLYNFIYIDNPNNPTGQVIDIADIEKIVSKALKNDITVIIDEAYGEFMPKRNSAIRLCEKYPNLVVVRTLSKGFGLAGMRVGYIIACKELIHCMNKMVNPYMVGELSREVAAEALKHHEFITKSKKAFASMKREIRRELGCTKHNPEGAKGRLHMAETLDTNSLLLLYHDDKNINLKDEFFKRGVLVIDGYDFKGLDSSAARVRLPKKRDFPKLLRAIREINQL